VRSTAWGAVFISAISVVGAAVDHALSLLLFIPLAWVLPAAVPLAAKVNRRMYDRRDPQRKGSGSDPPPA
jgi:hypothetical protein